MAAPRWNPHDVHEEWLDDERYLLVENDRGDGGRVLDRRWAYVQSSPLSLRDAEDVADRFVSALELSEDGINDPMGIVAAIGAEIKPWVRRACRAMLTWEPRLVLRGPANAPEPKLKRYVIHELGHAAAEFAGIERPHDEDWIDAVGAAVWLRRKAVRRALRLFGWNAPLLMRAFGEVPADIVFRRVGPVGGGVAIVRSRSVARRVFAPEHIVVPERAAGLEKRWMDAALIGTAVLNVSQEGAWPIRDPIEGDAGVILISPTTLDSAPWRLGNG